MPAAEPAVGPFAQLETIELAVAVALAELADSLPPTLGAPNSLFGAPKPVWNAVEAPGADWKFGEACTPGVICAPGMVNCCTGAMLSSHLPVSDGTLFRFAIPCLTRVRVVVDKPDHQKPKQS